MSQEEDTLFVRSASGLARSVSTLDAFLMGTFMINIGVGGAIVYGMGAGVFPTGNLAAGMLISTVGVLFTSAVYAMLTAAMPRSGGDYAYVSRILHPAIGFAGNFNFALLNIFWIASDTLLLVYILGIAFYGVATVTGSAALLAAATALSLDPTTIVVATTAGIILYGVIAAAGIKWCMRTQLVAFVLGIIGVILAIGLFAGTSNADFINKYNLVMGQNGYSNVIDAAKNTGLVLGQPQELIPTFGIASIACLATLYGFYPTYIGSEVKNASSLMTQIKAMVGSSLFGGLMITLVAFLAVNTIGQDYLASVNYILYVDPSNYPFVTMPYYNLLAAILANSYWIAVVLGIAYVAWCFIWPLNCVLTATRCMFAWSFDRVVPSHIAYVHPRYRTPLVSIAITTIVAEILAVLLVYNQALYNTLFGSIAGTMFSMVVVMIAGIVFPYRRKDIYEKSPSIQKVAGIPLVSILGVIGLAFLSVFLYFYVTHPEIGLWAPMSVALFLGVWVVGFAVYFISYLVRKSQGVDLGMLFKEIPPG